MAGVELMGFDVSVDLRQLEQFEKQLEQLDNTEVRAFMESSVKELATRLLAKVIPLTPVGNYHKEITRVIKRGKNAGQTRTERVNPSGKQGGTLIHGWTSMTEKEAEDKVEKSGKDGQTPVSEHLGRVRLIRSGGLISIQVTNPVSYAPFVEYGHRARGGKGAPTPGKHMLTISVEELQTQAQAIVEQRLTQFLKGVFPDD